MLRVRPLTMMVIMKITQAVESRAASSLYRYAFSSTNYHFFYSASASANVGLQRTAELNRNIQYQCEKVVHCVQASSPCTARETISSTADPATVPVGCSVRSQLINNTECFNSRTCIFAFAMQSSVDAGDYVKIHHARLYNCCVTFNIVELVRCTGMHL